MITSVTTLLLMALSATMTGTSTNPVKISVILMIFCSSIFLTMAMGGLSWFPVLFFLIFMGGILMMFMILSSILPNEKSKMSKKLLVMSLILFLIVWPTSSTPILNTQASSVKALMQSSNSFSFLTILMLMYFFCSMSMLTSENTSLRSNFCHKNSNFVNYLMQVALIMTRKEEKILSVMNNTLWDLPSPSTMSYFWNFGSTLGICLIVQILTGLLLTFHYTSFAEESFSSIVEIMREVWSGWVLRFIHMNGASVFFFFIYLHLFRGMFFLSAVHKKVWISGVTIMIVLMAISFLGYVLPWGQMSYWAVAVITNLLSVIPLIGDEVVNWIWGGFSVGSPTLTRFYSLHFLLPFVLAFLVIVHLIFLHEQGSSNTLGVDSNMDKIQFHPYFSVKDLVFIMLVIIMSLMVSFFFPYILGDAINNVPANSMQTPVHIQPEWYFLPSYAILRALPSKTAGVLALLLSVSIFYFIAAYKMTFSTKFSMMRNFFFWVMLASFIYLMKMGALPAEDPYVDMSKVGAMVYFSSILLLNL